MTPNEALAAREPTLLPCPWCGNAPHRKRGKINPYAVCRTEGCYGKKMPVVSLDDPNDVEAWNTRASLSAPKDAEVRECISLLLKQTAIDLQSPRQVRGYLDEDSILHCRVADLLDRLTRPAPSREAALREALRACSDYIASPLRMSSDEDEQARRERLITIANVALSASQPETKAAWHPRIGDQVAASEHFLSRYGEWARTPLWVVGMAQERGVDGINVTVSTEWPVNYKSDGYTDGFYINRSSAPDDLYSDKAKADEEGCGADRCKDLGCFGMCKPDPASAVLELLTGAAPSPQPATASANGCCCSAISPCSHQQNDPTSICDTCKAAASTVPDAGAPAQTVTEGQIETALRRGDCIDSYEDDLVYAPVDQVVRTVLRLLSKEA